MMSIRTLLILIVAATNAHATPLVIDGTETSDFPAVFGYEFHRAVEDDEIRSQCTAFLVHPTLLLTAAHCLTNLTSIQILSNGRKIGEGINLKVSEYSANPLYEKMRATENQSKPWASGRQDIGYIRLKRPVTDIAPLEVRVSTDESSRRELLFSPVTVVGYGANQWQKSGDYSHAGGGLKRFGTNLITQVFEGLFFIREKKHGLLPGDSGGPTLVTIGDKQVVVALHHKMVRNIQQTEFKGNIETPLSEENVCWVERASKVKFTSVICPSPSGL